MRYAIYIKSILVFCLISISLGFSKESNAQLNIIATFCAVASIASTTNHWENHCYMIIDEQETADAADGLKMFFTMLGTPYIGGVSQGFQSLSGWYDGYVTPTPSPYTQGYFVHSGYVSAEGYAIKYNDIPTNSVGITWDTMCALANFYAKPVGGAFVYYPEFDSAQCIPSPISTE